MKGANGGGSTALGGGVSWGWAGEGGVYLFTGSRSPETVINPAIPTEHVAVLPTRLTSRALGGKGYEEGR